MWGKGRGGGHRWVWLGCVARESDGDCGCEVGEGEDECVGHHAHTQGVRGLVMQILFGIHMRVHAHRRRRSARSWCRGSRFVSLASESLRVRGGGCEGRPGSDQGQKSYCRGPCASEPLRPKLLWIRVTCRKPPVTAQKKTGNYAFIFVSRR